MEKNHITRPPTFFAVSAAKRLLDVMLPPTCPGCKTIVSPPGGLCPECWEKITFISAPTCSVCGHPFEFSGNSEIEREGLICGPCARTTPPFSRARAAFMYDDFSRKMVLAFKHADQTHLAKFFAAQLERVGGELINECDLIIPIPISRTKLFSRRYNQSAEIARILARNSAKDFHPGVLKRIGARGNKKSTQANLSRRARFENVRGVFVVPSAMARRLKGKSILLVDDVLTTGATVTEATRTLLRAGAKNVDVLTLALVGGPK
ncbi:MAG: ComF family protein [Rhodospirillaceae bacterium]|nr:ComF family protein [Rhodospirillaceae bacterium]